MISLMSNLSLQDYITSIIKEFDLNNPYLVGSVEVKNIDLITNYKLTLGIPQTLETQQLIQPKHRVNYCFADKCYSQLK